MTLYKNTYRVESTRLPNRDYGANGCYFITICTKNRQHFFGEVVEGKLKLSDVGEIANKFWSKIPNHFQHTNIDSYIVIARCPL